MAGPIYRGYSSVQSDGPDTALVDATLVKQDLLNHLNTKLDERVGRPRYGSIIHDLLFDMGDDRTEGLVVQDVERIINSDPRVQLLEVIPTIDLERHSITVEARIRLIEFNMDDFFSVTFRPN